MMERIPEPELMNDDAQARAYAYADFATPHQLFVDSFREKFPAITIEQPVLDLGCGPCDVTRRFAQVYTQAEIHAVDGAAAMLKYARLLNTQQGLAQRIQLIEAMLPGAQLPLRHYHTIISNSLLHHLHDPTVLWENIHKHSTAGSYVFVMDLYRPGSEQQAREMVNLYAAGEAEVLQQDFYHSLLAAFTPVEVQQQLAVMGLDSLQVESISDRHMIIYGKIHT